MYGNPSRRVFYQIGNPSLNLCFNKPCTKLHPMWSNQGHSIVINSSNNHLDKHAYPITKIHMAEEDEVVEEGKGEVGVEVDMETTKKMADIQTGAEVVVAVAEVGGTVSLGFAQNKDLCLWQVVGMKEAEAAGMKVAEAAGMKVVEEEAGMKVVEVTAGMKVVEVTAGMKVVEVAAGMKVVEVVGMEAADMKVAEVAGMAAADMKVVAVVAGMKASEVEAEDMKAAEAAGMKAAEVVGMKVVEVVDMAAAEVMGAAVDGWAAAQGVAETRHINWELVFFALAKCLPRLGRYYIRILFWNSEIMACIPRGFEAWIWFFFIML
ncbi:alba DNA/RNA-binding protein [Actinidia rufa]|uniref:Alba DNA/RNA-binding protein n=1 Tax=Actinidia rufa TaxID=165716 RepID=A0A7J0FLA5_9ERIC|nr:alba DNA/RNA-binding protein [Actinidia rufa]